MATVLIGSASWGQSKMTKEEARQKAADVMIVFVEAVEPIYQESKPKSYDAFLAALYPTTKPALTVEANALLNDVYNYLKNNTSSSAIMAGYNGISLARAAESVSNKLNGTINLDELFTGTAGDFNPYEGPQAKSGGCDCKWYQIACWADCVFGEGFWGMILPILINLL